MQRTRLLPSFLSSIFPALALFVLLLYPCGAEPFSLKQIEVKSRFGEPFLAEVLALNDGKAGLAVKVGSKSDYNLLGLDRKSVVDSLIIDKKFVSAGPGRQLLRIYSKKPLFYPSFDLVLKATLEGNSVMENFFLAVDFRTDLSIGIVKPKEKKKAAKGPSKKPHQKKPHPPRLAMEKTPETPASPPSSARESIVAASPVPQPEEPKPLKPEPTRPAPEEPAQKEAPEREPAPNVGPAREFEKPKPVPVMKKEAVAEKRERPLKKKFSEKTPFPSVPVFSGGLARRVRAGDTLFKVAGRITKDRNDIKRVVVALWSLNKGKFLNGNMNSLEKGVRLNYAGLDKSMSRISHRDAGIIIKNQWDEFLYIKSMLADKKRVEEESPIKEVFLPGEMLPDKESVLKRIDEWKEAWQREELNRYISHYSTMFRARVKGDILSRRGWKERKERIFASQQGISVLMGSIRIRRERDHYIANFYQHYKSDKLDSYGVKRLDFIRGAENWSIFREGFQKIRHGRLDSPRFFPYAVYVASFKGREKASKRVNSLRRLGYSAYIAPVAASGKTSHYRVVVGRFSSKSIADRFSASLIRLELIPRAVSLSLPYALEMGVFDSESDAYEHIRGLRLKGVSAYLLSEVVDAKEGMRHRVLVGAYETEQKAKEISTLLNDAGIENRVTQP